MVQATRIGFFRSDNTDPTLVQEQPTFWLAGGATTPQLRYTNNPSETVRLKIPDAVAAVEGVWWIRVFNADTAAADNNKWSPKGDAQPLLVGKAVLECDSGSLDGNFGTLKLPRTSTSTATDLPLNIAEGLQSPLSLTKHQQWTLDSPVGKCFDGLNGAVTSPGSLGTLNANTNCVSTDTGLAANDATQGLISGVKVSSITYPGLLTRASTKTNCDPNGTSANRSVTVNGPGRRHLQHRELRADVLPDRHNDLAGRYRLGLIR